MGIFTGMRYFLSFDRVFSGQKIASHYNDQRLYVFNLIQIRTSMRQEHRQKLPSTLGSLQKRNLSDR